MPQRDRSEPSTRGFASMEREKQREIARKGGESVPPAKRTFARDPALAAAAGRKGGENVPAESRSFSKYPELARAAGRKGGMAAHRSTAREPETDAERPGDGSPRDTNE